MIGFENKHEYLKIVSNFQIIFVSCIILWLSTLQPSIIMKLLNAFQIIFATATKLAQYRAWYLLKMLASSSYHDKPPRPRIIDSCATQLR